MKHLIESLGMSKQNFYQQVKRRHYQQEEAVQILYLVEKVRENHPHMSVRRLYNLIQPQTMGRDKFERLCMSNGYGVRRRKNYRVTTNSKGVTRFPNLMKEIEVTGVNQVFVSDITYYELNDRFYYLTFIMDLWNREIVGYSVSDNLRTENTTLPALRVLIRLRGKSNLEGSIFHSDGGGQYFSQKFKDLTAEASMKNSMTQEKVYENSHAERLNGVIKNDYLYPYAPTNKAELRTALKKAIWMYNNEKMHDALGGQTPVQYRKKDAIDNKDIFLKYRLLSTANNQKQDVNNLLSN